MIQNYVELKTTFKKHPKKQYKFRSASGKEQQLDYGEIDRRNRRYCTDTESNDMIHLGSDHRSVIAHFRFPCVKKMRGLNNKDREQNLCKKYKIHETLYINGTTPRSRFIKNTRTWSEYVMNLKKGSLVKHEAAAHEELEILERQHTTTAAAGNDVADITSEAAAHDNDEHAKGGIWLVKQSSCDGSAQRRKYRLGLIEKRKHGQKRQGPSERHQQEDQTENQRQRKVQKT